MDRQFSMDNMLRRKKLKKYIIVVIAICCISILLVFSFLWLPKGNIEYNSETDQITFNNATYNCADDYWTCSRRDSKNLNVIAWTWYIPLLGKSVFYSDDILMPDFIYNSRSGRVWLKQNYDFTKSVFVINKTNISYQLSETYTSEIEKTAFNGYIIATFTWHPIDHQYLQNNPSLFLDSGKYYIQFQKNDGYYEISEEFHNSLVQIGILPT